jgi:multicomponent Na+:H+ antiporter subunit A
LSALNPAMVLLIAAFAAPVLVSLAGAVRPAWVPNVAILTTAIAFGVVLWTYTQPDSVVNIDWAPTWNLMFHLELDGLARMYALLATGIGLFVAVYASRYVPLHLHHGHRSLNEQIRFFGFLLLFMASMVGLVMSQDMILIFVFWDLTAVASYFLIGFDRMEEESRSSAQMAILVTGISAVFVLIGAVVLEYEYGTFALPEIIAEGELRGNASLALFLVMIGALAKSAQVPMHFWLPRAMAAPTPVSAYLHSAAMVAAGVFLIGRFYPLIAMDDRLLDLMMVIGYGSMVVGGIIALTRNVLKQILAYSTISQYGYVVFMFGMGGKYGIAGATFYVLAHALVKSALFLTAGAVTEATGKKTLSEVGGLARRMPLLAAGSGLASMGLIALPFTIGFFKDELFFAAASERGLPFMIMAVVGAALTFAYIVRFWVQTFLGPLRIEPRRISGFLVWPIVVLGVMTVVGGIWTRPDLEIAIPAASVSANTYTDIDIAYHLDTRPENVMAVATWGLGLLIYLTRRVWWPVAIAFAHLGERFGPAHLYYAGLQSLNAFSDRIHAIEVRDLRSRVATILLPAGVLVGIAVIVTPNSNSFEIGGFEQGDLPVIAMLVAAVVSAIVVAFVRDHFRIAIGLSLAGYSLAAIYALMGAPNVTVVALVVETLLSMFIMGMLVLMPRPILRFETLVRGDRRVIPRDAIIAFVSALLVFFVAWGALSRPAPTTEIIDSFTVLTPAVHGRNIVTVILADFRGFDTMGEVTVIALTLLGVISLLRSGRLR